MMFNQLFIQVICFLIMVSLFVVLKVIFKTKSNKNSAKRNIIILESNLVLENLRLYNNRVKQQLSDDLQESLFNRFFIITRDLLLIQKHIFEMHFK